MADRQLAQMISLATKAGKIAFGEDGCIAAMQKGQACAVFVATDASAKTKEKFANKAKHYKLPVCTILSKAQIQNCTGKHNRAVFAVTDRNFAEKIEGMVSEIRSQKSEIRIGKSDL